MTAFDYVVVGAGASGCVLARRLAESGRHSVCLLEAGPDDAGREEVADLGRYGELLGGALDYGYRTPRNGSEGGWIAHPRGRVLGGSSSINTCIWFPPSRSDLEAWVAGGAEGWGADDTAASRARLAATVRRESMETADPASLALREACAELGLAPVDFEDGPGEGFGWAVLAKRGRRRQSAAEAYLRDLPPSARLEVRTDTRAEAVRLGSDLRAIGVETDRGPVEARREVVLAAGAFESPKLLMLSGIGPALELRRHGVAVRRDLPGVGRHLADHVSVSVCAAATRPPARLEPFPWATIAFLRSGLGEDADLEMQLGSVLLHRHADVAPGPGFTVYIGLRHPRSEGCVGLASADPAANARLEPGYLSDPGHEDERRLSAGVEIARRLLAQPALRSWVGPELQPGPDANVAGYVRRRHGTDYHPAGTCRMGAVDDGEAVVGPDLRVHGVHALRVCDASVFPRMVGANIVATCMLLGERAAELMLAEAAERSRVA